MSVTIALAGNPNCGKTTMFNALTGANQYVGNWPGVTVEKKEGKLKNQKDVTVTDLPGIYSLSPYTLEEVVSRDYLLKEKPDVIIDLVDATNIERNLYLATQLLEIGIPVVIALNMVDLLKKNNIHINVKGLSSALGCPIVETSALKGTGLKEVVDEAIKCANQHRVPSKQMEFPKAVEKAVNEIEGFQITGEKEPEKILAKIRELYPKAAIVLTLGGDGSVYQDETGIYRQGIYKVKAVDTTAAGDTFTGYFISSIINGMPVQEGLRLAAKASAIAVSRPGATASIPLREEVLNSSL